MSEREMRESEREKNRHRKKEPCKRHRDGKSYIREGERKRERKKEFYKRRRKRERERERERKSFIREGERKKERKREYGELHLN